MRVSHYVAHTNADIANPGVLMHWEQAGLDLRPLVPTPASLSTSSSRSCQRPTLTSNWHCVAGESHLGDYDSCTFSTTGYGTPVHWRRDVAVGVGRIPRVAEAG